MAVPLVLVAIVIAVILFVASKKKTPAASGGSGGSPSGGGGGGSGGRGGALVAPGTYRMSAWDSKVFIPVLNISDGPTLRVALWTGKAKPAASTTDVTVSAAPGGNVNDIIISRADRGVMVQRKNIGNIRWETHYVASDKQATNVFRVSVGPGKMLQLAEVFNGVASPNPIRLYRVSKVQPWSSLADAHGFTNAALTREATFKFVRV